MNFMKQTSPIVLTSENALKRLIIYNLGTTFTVITALIIQSLLGIEYFVFGLAQIMSAVLISLLIVIIQGIGLEHYLSYKTTHKPLTYGLLAALLLPVLSPVYLVPLVIILMHIIEFLFYKLFHKNIVHPVLLSLAIIYLLFPNQFLIPETMQAVFDSSRLEIGRIRFLFGAYEGVSLGATSFMFLAMFWVYMSVSKIIDYKRCMWFLLHLLIYTTILYFVADYTLWTLFNRLFMGYTLFIFVFFIGEPTASPELPETRAIFPFITAVSLVFLRLEFDLVFAPIYAVLIAQSSTWIIEQFYHQSTRFRLRFAQSMVVVSWIAILIYTLIT